MTLSREPTLILGTIGTLISLAVGFGAPITTSQMGLIMAFVAALLSVINRSQVSPKQDIQTALDAPSGTTQKELAKIIEKQN